LIHWTAAKGDGAVVTSVGVYGAALIASFVASTLYHFTPWHATRPVLRRIDHAAIYVKIAGTYTPLVVLIGSAFAYGVLAFVWGLAVLGVVMKLFFWARPGRLGLLLYVGMGWVSIALLTSLAPLVSGVVLALMIAGGLIYTAGAGVFSRDTLRFQMAIWHSFVLVASICFFAAIVIAVAI